MSFLQSLFNPRKIKISLDNKEYPKLNLGDFFYLKELIKKSTDVLQRCQKEEFVQAAKKIIQIQTKKEVEITNITNFLRSLLEIKYQNFIESKAVFLIPPPQETKEKKPRYDYPDRNLAIWINTFAEKYHWSLQEILNLPIDTAIYLMQEIMINEHNDNEFIYSLSENAYQYDKSSGKSNYVPLKKPYWMDDKLDAKIEKNTKILKSMLPKGNVIDLSGVGLLKND